MNSLTPTKSTTAATPPSSSTTTRSSFTTPHSLPFPTKTRHSYHRSPHQHHPHHPLKLRAIDAAQPYDHESKISSRFNQSTKLKIAVIGFGNYGQFLAIAFIRQGHTVLAHSRTDYSALAHSIGATFFKDPNDLCERHPDVILICTSIMSTKQVLMSLPVLRLRRSTLFVDVLSVKEFPRNLFIEYLPKHFDILCTHPMFGPESGKDSWRGLPFVYDMVRIEDNELSRKRVERFLEIFDKEGCRMVEMSCAEHDKYAAGSQFITHTMGRVLEKMGLQTTPINTKGYETLLDLVDNTSSDSFDLYYGLFMYNEKAMEELRRLGGAFEELKMELFGHLHEANRNQLFRSQGKGMSGKFKLKGNGGALPSQNGNNAASPAQLSTDIGELKVDQSSSQASSETN